MSPDFTIQDLNMQLEELRNLKALHTASILNEQNLALLVDVKTALVDELARHVQAGTDTAVAIARMKSWA